MTSTMKGFLRGLRYITHIFEDKEEQEMQIGVPTDVKHVAHIGMDGPSANAPSWMTGFKSVPELANEPYNANGPLRNSAKHFAVEDVTRKAAAEVEDSGTRAAKEKARHRSRRKPSIGTGSPISSPTGQQGRGGEGTKQTRRHTTTSNNNSSDSGNNHKSSRGGGAESSPNSNESSSVSKHTRRKKTKGSTSGESTKGSKTTGQSSSSETFPSTENEPGSELGQGTKNESNLSPISERRARGEGRR